MRTVAAFTAVLALSACETMSGPGPGSGGGMTSNGNVSSRNATASSSATAIATLRDAQGVDRGTAEVSDAGNGNLQLTVTTSGASPGARGIHVHTVGRCDAPSFETAGPHWNPTARQHGRDNPAGAHTGDLPNITINGDGRGTLTATMPGTMEGLLDSDGSAVIIHAGTDDYRTDPSGNSGARLQCGVFARR